MATNATNARCAKDYDYGKVDCEDCGVTVQRTGTRTKLCAHCKRQRKRAHDRQWARENAEANRERARRWARENRDKVKAQKERYKRLGISHEWDRGRYARDAEKIKRRMKRYYEQNQEKVLARHRSLEGREAARRREAEKRKCPHYRMHTAVSRHIRDAIRDKGRRHVFDLLPYSREELVAHLERQFAKGMSWENYGRDGWHIDHIVPRSAFSYTSADDPDFQACWALTNLRPMWASDNIRKHASREFLL